MSISLAVNYAPDTDMLEAICENERDAVHNERDAVHLVGRANTGVKILSAVLAMYAGTYEFRDGPPVVAGFFGKTETFTVIDGQLWMNAIPLIPQSETRFDSAAASGGVLQDAHGEVAYLMLRAK